MVGYDMKSALLGLGLGIILTALGGITFGSLNFDKIQNKPEDSKANLIERNDSGRITIEPKELMKTQTQIPIEKEVKANEIEKEGVFKLNSSVTDTR